MIDDLAALIALQALDSAADAAHKRINEVPGAERALDEAVETANAAVAQAKAKVDDNNVARRGLEKEVAGIDARMAKFEDHKAAVKTNQEFQALNHEIEVAEAGKSSLEDQIIVLMDEADTLTATLKGAEAVLKERKDAAATERKALHADRKAQEAELARLSGERATAAKAIPPPLLVKYNQIAKNRRGIAVAEMAAGHCTACHVRLRPHVEQQVRRNDSILACDSCQRILYFVPPAPAASAE
jgi:predicted  nucleic acid-binding Zn-ribbon protein